MKKLSLILLGSILLLSGCGSKEANHTYMAKNITNIDYRKNNLYSLRNTNGKIYTDYLYSNYKQVNHVGYIVNVNKQLGLINQTGENLIKPGTYQTLLGENSYITASKEKSKVFTFKQTEITLKEEGTYQTSINDSKDVSYQSLNKQVATIDKKGYIHAISKGSTLIKATKGSYTTYMKVNVNALHPHLQYEKMNVYINSTFKINIYEKGHRKITYTYDKTYIKQEKDHFKALKVGQTDIKIKVGSDTLTLKLTINEKTISFKQKNIQVNVGKETSFSINNKRNGSPITYSYDKQIISINKDKIKGLKIGETTLKAKLYNQEIEMKIRVVSNSTRLSDTNIYLQQGKQKELRVYNVPSKAKVSYSSSDKNIVEYKDGRIKAKKVGTATIKAKINNKTYETKVTVYPYVYRFKEIYPYLYENDQVYLDIENKGKNKVTYQASNKNVEIKGNQLIAKKAGNTIIYAKVNNQTLTMYLTIQKTNYTLKESNITMYTNSKYKIQIDNLKQSVTSKSSNESVLTVNGLEISSHNSGNAKVTIKINNQELELNVHVKEKVISLKKDKIELVKGKKTKIEIVNVPSNTKVIYSTSDQAFIKLGNNGEIEALAPGKAIVNVTVNKKVYTCTIIITRDYSKIIQTRNLPFVSNTNILDSNGKVIKTTSSKYQYKLSKLPIEYSNGIYKVYDGKEVIYQGKDEPHYVDVKGNHLLIGFASRIELYKNTKKQISLNTKGNYLIQNINGNRGLLYDKENQAAITYDYNKKEIYLYEVKLESSLLDHGLFLITNKESSYLLNKGQLISINSYYKDNSHYIIRNDEINKHVLINGKKQKTIESIQLYPGIIYLNTNYFPVYQENKGYYYIDLNGKTLNEKIYLKASAFDNNKRAIVQNKNNTYSLINEKGEEVLSGYSNIALIDDKYYACFDKNNAFEVYKEDGEKLLEEKYTSYSEDAYYTINGKHYLLLNKSGQNILYNLDEENEVIVKSEKPITVYQEGYYVIDNYAYYTMKGKKYHD